MGNREGSTGWFSLFSFPSAREIFHKNDPKGVPEYENVHKYYPQRVPYMTFFKNIIQREWINMKKLTHNRSLLGIRTPRLGRHQSSCPSNVHQGDISICDFGTVQTYRKSYSLRSDQVYHQMFVGMNQQFSFSHISVKNAVKLGCLVTTIWPGFSLVEVASISPWTFFPHRAPVSRYQKNISSSNTTCHT